MNLVSIPAALRFTGVINPRDLHAWCDTFNNRRPYRPIIRIRKRICLDSLESAITAIEQGLDAFEPEHLPAPVPEQQPIQGKLHDFGPLLFSEGSTAMAAALRKAVIL